MFNRTRLRPIYKWVLRHLRATEDKIFRAPDLDAASRGWQVRRDRPFSRTYRDPRWDFVSACARCSGSGLVGVDECPDCEGDGTIYECPSDQPCRS